MNLDLYEKIKFVQLVNRLKAKKEAARKKAVDKARNIIKKR